VTGIVAIAIGSAALAQLSSDDRKCSDKINNDARKEVAAEGKGNRKTCVDAGSGDISACVATVQASSQASKLSADFTAKCGTLPPFGVNASDAAINAAAQDAADNIIKDVFGDPTLGIVSGDKCQDKMAQRPYQLAVAEWKAFRGCAKGLGAINTITDLETCVASGITAGETAKGSKVDGDAGKKCTTFPPGSELGGACTSSADAATLSACIRQHVDCEVCKGIYTSIGDDANNLNCNTVSGLVDCVVPPCVTPPPGACPLAPGKYTTTQLAGGTLTTYTFAPYPFPPGGTIVEDVGVADVNCVHDVVVPMPGGLTVPNFCVPGLGLTVSVTQTGCGIGKIDSDGGSDFTISELEDTSNTMGVCSGLGGPLCAGTTPTSADTSVRVDIKVGDGVTDTCASGGTANSVIAIPVHTVSWQDLSPGNTCHGGANNGNPCTVQADCNPVGFCGFSGDGAGAGCLGNGHFDMGTDTIAAAFDQNLDFTTDKATTKWQDLDGNGCFMGGFGPAAGFSNTGKCIDTVAHTITAVAAGGFGSNGGLFDGSFISVLPSTIAGPDPSICATCGSPPVINFAGTATRCIP
jgi:hypothetical protein